MRKKTRPTYTCELCHKPFTTSYSLAERPTGPPKFCNQTCYRASRTLRNKDKVRKPATCHPTRPHVGLGLCGLCYSKHHRNKNVEAYRMAARRYNLRKLYGLLEADYLQKYDQQNGLCSVCGEYFERWCLDIDHSHKTGKVRDLLCKPCNSGLGCYQDSIETLQKAIDYLKRHQ